MSEVIDSSTIGRRFKDKRLFLPHRRATGQIAGHWVGNDAVSDRQMGDYVAELTGVTPSFVEGVMSFDSFVSDNTRREQLIGKCWVHWKDGVRDTFERLKII